MKRLIAMGLGVAMLAAGVRVHAEDGVDVTYVGGTAPGFKEGAVAKLDLTDAKDLKLHAGGAEFSAPYAQVSRVGYREQNRFRLGPAATLVVGILKAREKAHMVTIAWTDGKGGANAVTLEMPRERAMALMDVLKAKSNVSPTVCEVKFNERCPPVK